MSVTGIILIAAVSFGGNLCPPSSEVVKDENQWTLSWDSELSLSFKDKKKIARGFCQWELPSGDSGASPSKGFKVESLVVSYRGKLGKATVADLGGSIYNQGRSATSQIKLDLTKADEPNPKGLKREIKLKDPIILGCEKNRTAFVKLQLKVRSKAASGTKDDSELSLQSPAVLKGSNVNCKSKS